MSKQQRNPLVNVKVALTRNYGLLCGRLDEKAQKTALLRYEAGLKACDMGWETAARGALLALKGLKDCLISNNERLSTLQRLSSEYGIVPQQFDDASRQRKLDSLLIAAKARRLRGRDHEE